MSFCSPSAGVQKFILSLAIFLPLELLPQGHKDEMDSPAMFPLYDSTTAHHPTSLLRHGKLELSQKHDSQ